MTRLRYNGLNAELASGLTGSATSVSFTAALTHAGGTNVPTITGSDYLALSILDSDGVVKEIVYLTAYTSGGTSGTIARGKEGTTGVSHSSGVAVVHSPTALDVGTPTYLLDHNTTPAAGSPEGVVFWKPPPVTTWSFTGGSLPSGWTNRSATSVSFDGTGMTATYGAGAGHQVAVPTLGGSQATVTAKFVTGSASGVMMGVMLTTSAGEGVGSVYYNSPSGLLAARVGAWQYASSFDAVGVATTYPAWKRLKMQLSGGNYSYKASRSTDGATYSSDSAAVTASVATAEPTVISVGSILGSATAKIEWVSFSGGSGGLQGYWDGSSILTF